MMLHFNAICPSFIVIRDGSGPRRSIPNPGADFPPGPRRLFFKYKNPSMMNITYMWKCPSGEHYNTNNSYYEGVHNESQNIDCSGQ